MLSYQGRAALRKRPARGLLAGLWEFPNTLDGWPSLARELGITPEMIHRSEPAGEAKHVFTHIEWRMKGMLLELERLPENNTLVWVTAREMEERYALSSAFHFALPVLRERIAQKIGN